MNFTGAGCLFFHDQFLLAGYQPRKQRPVLSGLGGKREGDEDFFTTALRESLEELFEITVPVAWIHQIQTTVPNKGVLKNGDYYLVLYSFEDLQTILQILNTNGCESPLYQDFPTNLLSLVFNRKQLEHPPEVSHLTFLPLVVHETKTPFVSSEFLKDMKLLLESGLLSSSPTK